MPGLKKHDPSFAFSKNKVTPDEIDKRVYYHVLKPSASTSFVGTLESATAAALVIDQTACDYPRNLLFTMTGVAGGMGGTIAITGTDQFGNPQTESIGFATANAGGTKAGTKIFDKVTAATVTPVGLGGTAIGTASLGFAVGTAANLVAWLGLPVKIGALADVKKIIWNDNGTIKGVNGGTVAGTTYVDTVKHAFRHNEIIAAADDLYVEIKSSYDSSNDAPVA